MAREEGPRTFGKSPNIADVTSMSRVATLRRSAKRYPAKASCFLEICRTSAMYVSLVSWVQACLNTSTMNHTRPLCGHCIRNGRTGTDANVRMLDC